MFASNGNGAIQDILAAWFLMPDRHLAWGSQEMTSSRGRLLTETCARPTFGYQSVWMLVDGHPENEALGRCRPIAWRLA
jgi:hypothetical protein